MELKVGFMTHNSYTNLINYIAGSEQLSVKNIGSISGNPPRYDNMIIEIKDPSSLNPREKVAKEAEGLVKFLIHIAH